MNPRLVLLFILFSLSANSAEPSSCLAEASTQFEMNKCEATDLMEIRAELERVILSIERAYSSTSPEFLPKLRASQKAWRTSLKANLAMKFPLENKRQQYGSVYPMCASGFEARLTLQRIEFLKVWSRGHGGGEVCSGSVIHSYCIKNDCSKIGK